jgi:hypothetical protein
MFKPVLAEVISSLAKFVLLPTYIAWTIKLIVVDCEDVRGAVSIAVTALSVYGVWMVIHRATEWVEKYLDSEGEKPPAGRR